MSKVKSYILRLIHPFLILVFCTHVQYGVVSGLISVLIYLIIAIIGVEIGLHRYFAHRSFVTSRPNHYFLLCIGLLSCQGSPLVWVGRHRLHHQYSDTKNDPHAPRYFGFWRVLTNTLFPKAPIEKSVVRDLLQDPVQLWIHRQYFLVHMLILLAGFSFGIEYVFFGLILPVEMSRLTVGIINSVGHARNIFEPQYKGEDLSYNLSILGFNFWGAGMHQYHHQYPDLENLETVVPVSDFCGRVIDTIFKMQNREKP